MSHSLTKPQLTAFIRERRFSELFIQLGWDKENLPSEPLMLELRDGDAFSVDRVVEKRGFVVCVCDAGDNYPSGKSERRRLVNQLARHHYEHLLIICGEDRQHWTVAIRPQNRPLRTLEVEWIENQDIQPLMEKLDGMIFDISEEETLGITDVVDRVRSVFMENAERVTKSFYGRFRNELSAFAAFITGIKEQVSKEWYAALMLNRLMFIYFIQKKRFLHGDINYLENRLRETRQKFGEDKFDQRFYRHFLRRLFSEGLGMPASQRDPELKKMLGKVPYLNGGLFDLHEVEQDNQDIQIPDRAFENLFAFFGEYHWHLDSRPTASGKDINPDVIGYIFEKYINDRAAMGAYYTQEDVTGYIARNTVIPFLLHRAKEKCKNAFDRENGIWRFLREHPDQYIYDAVKKGCDIPDEKIPQTIRRGMDTGTPGLLKRRADWNTPAESAFALPTEIWRETMARRKRYGELKAAIENGAIRDIDDLITHNLDIQRFASDALRDYEGSDFIDAFFEAIAGKQSLQSNQKEKRGITVLDPACGSGAFLFAALNILEPLYERCIERMRDFVEEDDTLREQGKRKGTKKYPQFRAVLEDIKNHQNEKYWIYKTIILNNLYGVDLMKEATEIAKLRLFLKLAAEAEYDPRKDNLGLEPLPDIDFNIRAGNSLVGFASMRQFEEVIALDHRTGQRKMNLDAGLVQEIREEMNEVQKTNQRFRKAQDSGGDSYRQAKDDLSARLAVLNEKLNRYLAEQYGQQTEGDYQQWLESHRPFHWLAEFYGIIEEDGGFDVVIGNPPYIEYSKVRKTYTVKDYETEACGNLYAFFVEKNKILLSAFGQTSMIIPHSAFCTDRMGPLMNSLINLDKTLYVSNYDIRPSKLFADVDQRLAIYLQLHGSANIETSDYLRWNNEFRQYLFETLFYESVEQFQNIKSVPKTGANIALLVSDKIRQHKTLFASWGTTGTHAHRIYFHNAPRYWIRATDFIPYFWNERDGEKQSVQVKNLSFKNNNHSVLFCALLNSSLFYWWFIICSDCRHLNLREIVNFPFNPDSMDSEHYEKLSILVSELMTDYQSHAARKETTYTTTGKVVYDEFYPRHSKTIIDKIDKILAKHYGFTEEELDYIINYDIKYRMGLKK